MTQRRDVNGPGRLAVPISDPALGIGGVREGQYHLKPGRQRSRFPDKPEYRVPSMAEINATPWNGLKVASTFSGCGGSCLGYRMAGFSVAWANEFVPAAQESYRANAAPGCVLDCRDIREVQAADILAATRLEEGELDLLDGSPPCQAFSTAGRREKNWGKEYVYANGKQQCNEDLFEEYIRLLRGLKPKAFVAENVSGLVKGTAKGFFLDILRELKVSGYRVRCRVLDAQWLGVPQSRRRVIFVGVREDLGSEPAYPRPLPYNYSVRDALPWIRKAVQDPKGQFRIQEAGAGPCFTIKAGSASHIRVMAHPRYDKTIDVTERPMLTITATGTHMPEIVEAETDISRFAIGKEWDRLREGEQSGKYFSLQRSSSSSPSPTICASHGSPGIASVTHPTEKRKFTIAELKRICAFPDDFVLTGSYAQQWERLGNSVPPVMMYHIAAAIRDHVLHKTA